MVRDFPLVSAEEMKEGFPAGEVDISPKQETPIADDKSRKREEEQNEEMLTNPKSLPQSSNNLS